LLVLAPKKDWPDLYDQSLSTETFLAAGLSEIRERYVNHNPAQQPERGFEGCHSCGLELFPLIRQLGREMTLRQANLDGPSLG
jgi:hypothetical protein